MRAASLLLCAFATITLVSCQSGIRKPSSANSVLDLQKEIEKIAADIKDPKKLNLDTCASYVNNVYGDVLSLSPSRFDSAKVAANWQNVFNLLWQTRVSLRERLTEFSTQVSQDDARMQACGSAVRDGFRLSRWAEDYITELYSGEPQDFKPGLPKNAFDPKFKNTPFRGDSPRFAVNPKYAGNFKIRSGDIIISRGNAYTSAAIARIGEVDSQFSHLAMIYIAGDGRGEEYTLDEAVKNLKVFVIESHIEVGSTIRPLKQYLEDNNARNVLFRYSDSLVAHRASKWAYDYIQNYRKNSFDTNPLLAPDDVNHNVPYNFQMTVDNPQNPRKLFCSQVAYVGYKNNGFDLPYFTTTVKPELSLTKRLGVTADKIFAPGDMELDPRFEMIAEYRNVRKAQNLRMKDMILASLFRWMEKGYEFTPSPVLTTKATYGWLMRQMDMSFVKEQIPRNMSVKILNTVFTLEKTAIPLEKVLAEEDERTKRETGFPLTYKQGLEFLEKLREKDEQAFVTRDRVVLFHNSFSRPGYRPILNGN